MYFKYCSCFTNENEILNEISSTDRKKNLRKVSRAYYTCPYLKGQVTHEGLDGYILEGVLWQEQL